MLCSISDNTVFECSESTRMNGGGWCKGHPGSMHSRLGSPPPLFQCIWSEASCSQPLQHSLELFNPQLRQLSPLVLSRYSLIQNHAGSRFDIFGTGAYVGAALLSFVLGATVRVLVLLAGWMLLGCFCSTSLEISSISACITNILHLSLLDLYHLFLPFPPIVFCNMPRWPGFPSYQRYTTPAVD